MTEESEQALQQRRNVPEPILDATCGGRSIWLPEQESRDDTLFIDKRELAAGEADSQQNVGYSIEPDEVQDFRDLPFADESFDLVVFDPPHAVRGDGMEQLKGAVTRKYGALHAETWQADLKAGFGELWRVLEPKGTLIFKFSDVSRPFSDVLELAPEPPLFGTRTRQTENHETRWFVFRKSEVSR